MNFHRFRCAVFVLLFIGVACEKNPLSLQRWNGKLDSLLKQVRRSELGSQHAKTRADKDKDTVPFLKSKLLDLAKNQEKTTTDLQNYLTKLFNLLHKQQIQQQSRQGTPTEKTAVTKTPMDGKKQKIGKNRRDMSTPSVTPVSRDANDQAQFLAKMGRGVQKK